MPNAFSKQPAQSLVSTASLVASRVEEGSGLVVRADDLSRLVSLRDEMEATLRAQEEVRCRYAALCVKRAETKAELARVLSGIAARAAKAESTSDETLIRVGFAPQSGPRRAIPLATPTDLVAHPTASGTTSLRWNRAGNGEKTMFVVERSDGGPFVPLRATKRTRLVVPDCAPGVTAYFRVSATTSTRQSRPCAPVVIYP